MERAIYFDGWHKNNHCYHPSLPFRSMQMIEDLEGYHGTLLVWSALGGGSISLPFLEHEAFGKVDPRLRFYGYMNDSEYIEECNRRGIKVFGIVFEVQGWEFPAVITESGECKALNVMRGSGGHDWYGLREFSQDKHCKLFGKKLEDYFPGGLYNSDNERVTDLWEECAARDYNNTPIHAQWVEVVNHAQICYQTCRNNPVWRAYLKKIIEIQIDAGVAGVQLDESELPITSLRHGGCFCKDCRKQFTAYLKTLRKNGKLDRAYNHIELDGFDYGQYLKSRGISFPEDKNGVPLFREYWEFQLRNVQKYFTELIDHAKEYGLTTKNKNILVSGNFFNGMPVYFPIENTVDIITTEMERTLFKQPYWYRYINGFANGKPAIIAENPYGGIVPELVEMLERGKGYDLYRIFLLEASMYGCNMAVPYGGWMGNTIKNAFHPPRDVTEQVQTFLYEKEKLFSASSGAGTLVLYSWPSYYWRESTKSSTGNVQGDENSILFFTPTDIDDPNTSRLPFWEIIKNLSDNQDIYDVRLLADGHLWEDSLSYSSIMDYELIILPDCDVLTENQTKVLEEYAHKGGRLLIFGRAGCNIAGWQEKIKGKSNVFYCDNPCDKTAAIARFRDYYNKFFGNQRQVRCDNPNVGLQLHKTKTGTALHILNYSYNSQNDRCEAIPSIEVVIRPGKPCGGIRLHSLDKTEPLFEYSIDNDVITLKIYNMELYTVAEIELE